MGDNSQNDQFSPGDMKTITTNEMDIDDTPHYQEFNLFRKNKQSTDKIIFNEVSQDDSSGDLVLTANVSNEITTEQLYCSLRPYSNNIDHFKLFVQKQRNGKTCCSVLTSDEDIAPENQIELRFVSQPPEGAIPGTLHLLNMDYHKNDELDDIDVCLGKFYIDPTYSMEKTIVCFCQELHNFHEIRVNYKCCRLRYANKDWTNYEPGEVIPFNITWKELNIQPDWHLYLEKFDNPLELKAASTSKKDHLTIMTKFHDIRSSKIQPLHEIMIQEKSDLKQALADLHENIKPEDIICGLVSWSDFLSIVDQKYSTKIEWFDDGTDSIYFWNKLTENLQRYVLYYKVKQRDYYFTQEKEIRIKNYY